MPISREKAVLYPPDWPEISRRIRFERAGGRCECRGECGCRNSPRMGSDGRCMMRHGQKIHRLDDGKLVRDSIVVLTVAHLDHDFTSDETRLRAMCQACHLTYDARHHAKNAATTRMKKREAAGQLRLGGDPETGGGQR